MNYLTLDAHKDESIHSGATFSTPVFFTPAFSSLACFFDSRVFHCRVFQSPRIICVAARVGAERYDEL